MVDRKDIYKALLAGEARRRPKSPEMIRMSSEAAKPSNADVAAARLRVAADRQLGRETPGYIVKMADLPLPGEDQSVGGESDG